MIGQITYNGDGSTRIFPVSFEILGEDYVQVFINNIAISERTRYDIINNSIVFLEGYAPEIGTDNVVILVASSPTEIGDLNTPPSNIQSVLDNMTNINAVASNKENIDIVASNTTNVTTVSNNILDINSVVTNIVPNLAEILQADTNATIATTKATEASASATSASNSATIATNQAIIATTKASEASASATSANNSATTATTKASEANASAISASNSATSASTSATTATTKANEASASASSSLTSANNANTSETMAYKWSSNPVDTIVETDKYSALHWATKAQQWASTVDTTNFVDRTTNQSISGVKTFSSSPIVPNATDGTQAIAYGQAVKNTGDETIAGVKTFSSSPIVPTPTTGTQAVNKDYVDNTSERYTTYGLGAEAILNDSFNSFLNTGFYKQSIGGDSPNNYSTILKLKHTLDADADLLFEHRRPNVIIKARTSAGGTRNSWVEILHSGNEQQIGVSQTWQNVTASRATSVTYTNSTAKPIFVTVTIQGIGAGTTSADAYVDGVKVASSWASYGASGTATGSCVSFIVLPGSAYYVTKSGSASTSIYNWVELK